MKTQRGFEIQKFKDLNGQECSIQESSLATKDAIWIGVHEHRMHIDRNQAENIMFSLARFVHTGKLPEFP